MTLPAWHLSKAIPDTLGMPSEQIIPSGHLKIEGNKVRLNELLGLFDIPAGDFNIMLP
jgi:alkyl sulfatase BDS1-like metallo-beta-lactamase superfamily hydrolase